MARSRTQGRPWVMIDSEEERLRLLEEAYSNDPSKLTDVDLYELCDLRDPTWALLQPSNEDSMEEIANVSRQRSDSNQRDESVHTPEITADSEDQPLCRHDRSKDGIQEKIDKSFDGQEVSSRPTIDNQYLKMETDSEDNPVYNHDESKDVIQEGIDKSINELEVSSRPTADTESPEMDTDSKDNPIYSHNEPKDSIHDEIDQTIDRQEVSPRPTADSRYPKMGTDSEDNPVYNHDESKDGFQEGIDKSFDGHEVSSRPTADNQSLELDTTVSGTPRKDRIGTRIINKPDTDDQSLEMDNTVSETPEKGTCQTRIVNEPNADDQTPESGNAVTKTPRTTRSEASEVLTSATGIFSKPSYEKTAPTDAVLSLIQELRNPRKRSRNDEGASSDGKCIGPPLKIQRIDNENGIRMAPESTIPLPKETASDETEGGADEDGLQLKLNTGDASPATGRQVSILQTWLEASHEYIPALLFSAFIVHLCGRNL